MRLSISIVVLVPDTPAEAQGEVEKEFVDGVLAIFRTLFPEAERLPPVNIDTPAPITVTIHTDREWKEEQERPEKSNIKFLTHEEILERMETEDKAKRGRRII